MIEAHSSKAIGEPTTLKKIDFAKIAGISPGRVSQLIAKGLPVEPSGRIDVARAQIWMAENINANRREAQTQTRLPLEVQRRKSDVDLERAELELQKARGELVDRKATERAIFGRARAERDAWLNWPLRIGAQLADQLDVDEAALLIALKRLVREHLAELSEADDVAA